MKTPSPRLVASALSAFLLSGISAQGALALSFNLIPQSYSGDITPIILSASVAQDGEDVVVVIQNNSTGGWATATIPTITDVYVDDTSPTFQLVVLGQDDPSATGTGVDYSYSTGGNFPSGNNVSFNADYHFSPKPPPNTNGIDPGESLTIRFYGAAGAGGTNYAAVEEAIANGDVRFGLHMQELPKDDEKRVSASFVALPGDPGPGVPEPTTTALGLIGTLLLLRRRRS